MGQKDSGPDAVTAMHVDRTTPAAFRAPTLVHFPDLFLHLRLRKLFGNAEKAAILLATGVAVPKIAVAGATEEDGGAAIVARSHTRNLRPLMAEIHF